MCLKLPERLVGSSSVRIRGVGTTGGNEPLYVIDGFPIGGGASSIAGSSDKVDGLSIINPNDIESIQVFKRCRISCNLWCTCSQWALFLLRLREAKKGLQRLL